MHYVGEPVAVVLAADPHVAEAAAQLIEAEYEELPAVYDEVEAMTSKAIVHDVLKPAGTFPDLKHLKGTQGHQRRARLPPAARRSGGGVRARPTTCSSTRFRTQQVLHLPLEPFVSVGEPTDTGLTIHTASQTPSFVRIEIARLLGWPENKVRVKVPYLGGGFGAKLYIKLEALVAALALIVRRPVKIALTMEEQFYTLTKHASTFRIKSGDQGRPHHRRANARCGGTAAPMPISARASRRSPASPRPAPTTSRTCRIDSYALYTNLPPAGALRGFGIPQLVWAYESHTDMIARALKLDPVEFRRKNILRDGRPQATGTPMKDAAIEAVLERAGAADELERAVRPRQRHR